MSSPGKNSAGSTGRQGVTYVVKFADTASKPSVKELEIRSVNKVKTESQESNTKQTPTNNENPVVVMERFSGKKPATPEIVTVSSRSKRHIKTPRRLVESEDATVSRRANKVKDGNKIRDDEQLNGQNSNKSSKNKEKEKTKDGDHDSRILELPSLSIKNISRDDLLIEIEVNSDLIMGPLEFVEEIDGKSKYGITISKEKTKKKSKKNQKEKKTEIKEEVIDEDEFPADGIADTTVIITPEIPESSGQSAKRKNEGDSEWTPTKKKKESGVKKTPAEKKKKKQKPVNSKEQKTQTHFESEASDNVKESKSPALDNTIDGAVDDAPGDDFELHKTDIDENNQTEDKTVSPKQSKTEDGKPKRKYMRRNAYNRDNEHYTIIKNDEGPKRYKCCFCGTEMLYHGNMKDHVRSHTHETPFACEICGKAFTSNNNLKGHLITHSDARPYVCDICGYAFKKKGHLTIHRARHDPSLSRYTCHICGKKFYSSTEVRKHIPKHTGEKNYECQICHKRFTQDSALARHRFLHTAEKPHKCEICGMSFIRREYFRRHKVKCHSFETSNMVYEKLKKESNLTESKEIVVGIPNEAAEAAGNLIEEREGTVYVQLDGNSYPVPYMEDEKGSSILYESMEIPVQHGEIIIITDPAGQERNIQYANV